MSIHPFEPDRPGQTTRKDSRTPDSGELRNGESALAREFANRALAPIVRDLRNRHGLLDPVKVASAVGITVPQLADCLELPAEMLKASPLPDELEERLEPFAMVIGIVRDVYGGDDSRVRTWLRTPRPELEGKTPNEALCEPAGVKGVISFVLGAWLRNAD
jgi:hypothetical protein